MNSTDTPADFSESGTEDPEFIFNLISFKTGFYFGLQTMCLILTLPSVSKNLVKSMPFIIQILWTGTNICWDTSLFLPDQAVSLQIGSNTLDFLTKAGVIYFIGYRLIVRLKDLSIKARLGWNIFLTTGILASLGGNIALCVGLYKTLDDTSIIIANTWYLFADVYISFISIVVLYFFIKHNFKLENFIAVWNYLGKMNLQFATFYLLMLFFLCTSFLITSYLGWDDDLNWDGSVAAFKYVSGCHMASSLISKVDRHKEVLKEKSVNETVSLTDGIVKSITTPTHRESTIEQEMSDVHHSSFGLNL